MLATSDLYYSRDQAQSWQRLPLQASQQRYDSGVLTTCPPLMRFDIQPSPRLAELLWVRVGRTLYRSDDGGQTWQARQDNVAVWVVSDDGELLYAMRSGMQSQVDGLYRSQDGGQTWQLLFSGLLPPIAPTQIQPEQAGCLSLALQPGEQALILGAPGGFYRSFDRGASWQPFNAGLQLSLDELNRVPLMVNAGASEIYALLGTGSAEEGLPYLAHLMLDQSNSAQDHWQIAALGTLQEIALPDETSFFGLYCLVPDTQNPGTLYLGSERGALLSQDYGQTWQTIELPDAGRITRIAASTGAGSRIYLWNGDKMVTLELTQLGTSEDHGWPSSTLGQGQSGETTAGW